MLKRSSLRWSVVLGVMCLAGMAMGQGAAKPADKAGAVTVGSNTVITAKTLPFDYKKMEALFEGDVEVVDPDVRMLSDKLTVLFDKDNNVKVVTASGHVKIWQGERVATCSYAVYDAQKGEVVLSGKAVLKRDKDTVSGNRVTFWVNEERMKVEPGTLIWYPKKGSGERRKLMPTPKLGPSRGDK